MVVTINYNDYWVDVDVPLKDIANILAERYKITGKAMYMIICDYDLDLTEDLENNQYILELAESIYRKGKQIDEIYK